MKKLFIAVLLIASTALAAQQSKDTVYQIENTKHEALKLTRVKDSVIIYAEQLYQEKPLSNKCLYINILVSPEYKTLGHLPICRKEEELNEQI